MTLTRGVGRGCIFGWQLNVEEQFVDCIGAPCLAAKCAVNENTLLPGAKLLQFQMEQVGRGTHEMGLEAGSEIEQVAGADSMEVEMGPGSDSQMEQMEPGEYNGSRYGVGRRLGGGGIGAHCRRRRRCVHGPHGTTQHSLVAPVAITAYILRLEVPGPRL